VIFSTSSATSTSTSNPLIRKGTYELSELKLRLYLKLRL